MVIIRYIGWIMIGVLSVIHSNAQTIFHLQHPDTVRSPFTGMTRTHWVAAAIYLLDGAFSYVHSLDDPMQFPKQEGKSYPRVPSQIPTEKLEGLARTLFFAAPLLKENPDLTLHGIKVVDYYRHQFEKLVDSTSPSYIKMKPKSGGPSQTLVEFGAMSMSLLVVPELLWDPLPASVKQKLAATMLSFGDGPTVPSNWKFFNIFVLSFFKSKGYPVNDALLEKYLQLSLEHYRGEGWYNDNPAFDYYSMWAFQMYGRMWSELYGKKYYPTYAAQFLQHFDDLEQNYPYMFSRDGKMIMWGRSISYRMASAVLFPFMGWDAKPNLNLGWMRRIASGVFLQFLQHPDFLKDQVPTLGFYGPFEPAVQSYSCRGSVYWMGKIAFALLLDEHNPFWTAVENEGPWADVMKPDSVYHHYQKSSQILVTDYPSMGAAEIRAWCHVKNIGANEPFRSSENYNRLAYNSAFPWQADGTNGEVAMNYVVKNRKNEWEPLRLYTFKGFENNIYYRDVALETDSNVKFHLADYALPNGVLRVDQVSVKDSATIRLGHYALPQLSKPISTELRKVGKYTATIIDNGQYQLATIPLIGWQNNFNVDSKGLHPEATQSKVSQLEVSVSENSQIPLLSLLLWEKSGKPFAEDALNPIRKVSYRKNMIVITMKSGQVVNVRKIIN